MHAVCAATGLGSCVDMYLVNKGLHIGVDAGRVSLQTCLLQMAPNLQPR